MLFHTQKMVERASCLKLSEMKDSAGKKDSESKKARANHVGKIDQLQLIRWPASWEYSLTKRQELDLKYNSQPVV